MSSFDPAIHVSGLWRCAKCNFVLVQSNLNAADGTITARDEAGDKCPNDGAPLWRVTWRQHAEEMAERCEEAITGINDAVAYAEGRLRLRRSTYNMSAGDWSGLFERVLALGGKTIDEVVGR